MNNRLKVIIEHLNSIEGIVVSSQSGNYRYRIDIEGNNAIGYLDFDKDNVLLVENAYIRGPHVNRDKKDLKKLLKYLKYKRLISLERGISIPLIIDKVLGIKYV